MITILPIGELAYVETWGVDHPGTIEWSQPKNGRLLVKFTSERAMLDYVSFMVPFSIAG